MTFIGHRYVDNPFSVEKKLDELLPDLLQEHECVEFLVGRDGEFDQLVSSAIHRAKKVLWGRPQCHAQMKKSKYEPSWADEAETVSAILDDDW